MFFDSHCHLTDERLFAEADDVVRRAVDAGVTRIVTIGVGPEDAERALGVARRHDGVWASVGVHPHDAAGADEATLERVRELAADPRIVALGEMGLDYHYDHSPRDVQRRVFARQLELARDLGLPVVIHSRDAEADTAALIRDAAAAGVAGVLHCFSSGAPLLEAGLDAGWCVSFAGLVTFKNFEAGDLVRLVPGDRMLAETDSPYLAPVPHRGKRNEPAFVPAVVAGLAAIRGEDAAALGRATFRIASRFYRLPLPDDAVAG